MRSGSVRTKMMRYQSVMRLANRLLIQALRHFCALAYNVHLPGFR
jgi:hypothetical protein